jgi:hypothetical protein
LETNRSLREAVDDASSCEQDVVGAGAISTA